MQYTHNFIIKPSPPFISILAQLFALECHQALAFGINGYNTIYNILFPLYQLVPF